MTRFQGGSRQLDADFKSQALTALFDTEKSIFKTLNLFVQFQKGIRKYVVIILNTE